MCDLTLDRRYQHIPINFDKGQCRRLSSKITRVNVWQQYCFVGRLHVNNAAQWQSLPWLQWRHNKRHGVSNHQTGCLFNRLFKRTSKKTPKLLVTGLCERNPRGIHRWSVDYPHKGPVTRKMFSYDDVIDHAAIVCAGTQRSEFQNEYI